MVTRRLYGGAMRPGPRTQSHGTVPAKPKPQAPEEAPETPGQNDMPQSPDTPLGDFTPDEEKLLRRQLTSMGRHDLVRALSLGGPTLERVREVEERVAKIHRVMRISGVDEATAERVCNERRRALLEEAVPRTTRPQAKPKSEADRERALRAIGIDDRSIAWVKSKRRGAKG